MSGGWSSTQSVPSGPTSYAAILAKITAPRRRRHAEGCRCVLCSKKNTCKIAHNTYASLVPLCSGDDMLIDPDTDVRELPSKIEITLHQNAILTLYPNGTAYCETSYESMLTRGRLNAYMPSGWGVYAHRGEQFVKGPDGFLMRLHRGVIVGWDTSGVREHLRALRIHPNGTKEARHARYELALYYTRLGWGVMSDAMRAGEDDPNARGIAFVGIPRAVRTPLYLRKQWPDYKGAKPLWLADSEGALVRPVTGADAAFDQVVTYATEHEPYAIIDGVKYRVVDPTEVFDHSQDVRRARKRQATLELVAREAAE